MRHLPARAAAQQVQGVRLREGHRATLRMRWRWQRLRSRLRLHWRARRQQQRRSVASIQRRPDSGPEPCELAST